jgi:hypothetical protein
MVKFRNVAGTAPVANWWHPPNHSDNQIAFSRGKRGNGLFFKDLAQTL